MRRRDKIMLGAAILIAAAAVWFGVVRTWSIQTLTGAVLRQDASAGKQLPIADAEIRIADDLADGIAKSDSTGYFHVKLRHRIRKGEAITIELRHIDYRPLDLTVLAADRLYVIRMVPVAIAPAFTGTPVPVSDLRVRYAMKNRTTVNVGTVVNQFEVQNAGDMPCQSNGPCSPDGKWKAADGGASLDAGDGNEFQDARVSCIGGPCSFTKIENDSFSRGGRQISVVVRNWSDAVSFVLEAEVMHTMNSDAILQSYPVIFNENASFTLPAKAQGPSIEATVDHQDIVYPLGPAPKLSWADCEIQVAKDKTKLFRCALKPGYRFN